MNLLLFFDIIENYMAKSLRGFMTVGHYDNSYLFFTLIPHLHSTKVAR